MTALIFFTLIKGFLIGLSIAAPVGPVGILCIKKTLSNGKLSGFAAGLGAAIADTLYGAVAAFGLVLVLDFLHAYIAYIQIIGALLLLYFGYKVYTSHASAEETCELQKHYGKSDVCKDFLCTFLLTLTNPGTVIAFMAIFAGLGVIEHGGPLLPTLSVVGVFFGSLCWWLFLSFVVYHTGKRMNERTLDVIHKVSGLLLIGFGVLVFAVWLVEQSGLAGISPLQ